MKRIGKSDLARPGRSLMLGSEAFDLLVGTIWNDLREEASRGMNEDDARMLSRG